jgi:hypothetical protein
MTGLVLPRHVAANLQKQKQEAAATAISGRSATVTRYDSDDFVSVGDVKAQLEKLQDYIDTRRQTEPDYQLPRPSGWKLMLLILTIPDETSGGLIMIDDSKEARSLASPQGVILAMGPAAYSDHARFTVDGLLHPWHKPGDRISFVRYDANMFQVANGQRLGFLNDTQPVALIDKDWKVPC